eukprot:1627294-Rhodomonas_salina.7
MMTSASKKGCSEEKPWRAPRDRRPIRRIVPWNVHKKARFPHSGSQRSCVPPSLNSLVPAELGSSGSLNCSILLSSHEFQRLQNVNSLPPCSLTLLRFRIAAARNQSSSRILHQAVRSVL